MSKVKDFIKHFSAMDLRDREKSKGATEVRDYPYCACDFDIGPCLHHELLSFALILSRMFPSILWQFPTYCRLCIQAHNFIMAVFRAGLFFPCDFF